MTMLRSGVWSFFYINLPFGTLHLTIIISTAFPFQKPAGKFNSDGFRMRTGSAVQQQ